MAENRKIIIYYGVSGHGKGLVDTMNGFGVKGPIKNVALTENFNYNILKEILSLNCYFCIKLVRYEQWFLVMCFNFQYNDIVILGNK